VKKSEREKNASGSAEEQAHDPKASFLRESRDRGDGDRDLKHGYASRENFVLVKIGLGLGFLFVRLFLNISLFLLISLGTREAWYSAGLGISQEKSSADDAAILVGDLRLT